MKKKSRNAAQTAAVQGKAESSVLSPIRAANRARRASILVAAVVAALFALFLSRPFVASAPPETSTPRWALLLAPLADVDFLDVVWFGADLPNAPYRAERTTAFLGGVAIFLAAFGLGRLVVALFLRRFFPAFKPRVSETIFFSSGIGLTAYSSFFYLVPAGKIATFAALGIGILPGIASFFVPFRRRGVETAPLPFATRFDKILSASQILLPALFASFYLFAATQPTFEYDALEYHLQGAREIFENGAACFSPTNVYANMPLGAEIFYYWGFRLFDAFGASSENVLRFGALSGKTVLVGIALSTALGLFAFCVRFFRDARAGLFAALLYLAFPRTFDVFSNGLNDGALGFALFAVFYLLALRFAASQCLGVESSSRPFATRTERAAFAGLLGIFVGFAVAIKYTAVVFVALPAFVALFVAPFFRRNASPSRVVASEDFRANTPKTNRNGTKIGVEIVATLAIFVATATLVGGFWFVRNFTATGNPVYPLAFGVFGDSSGTWNADVDARWRRAHSATDQSAAALVDSVARLAWRDDLASPFSPFVPFAGIAAIYAAFRSFRNRRKTSDGAFGPRTVDLVALIFAAVLLFWIVWHFATHRLTRFLVPISPLSALVLAAATTRILTNRNARHSGENREIADGARDSFAFNNLAKTTVLVVLAFGLCWTGLEIDLRGQGRLAPLRALERDPARFPEAAIYFNDRPGLFSASDAPDAGTAPNALLLVGEAKAFAYRIPVRYSTCWNRSPLIPLLDGAVERDATGKIVAVSDADLVRANFQREKIAFVLVDFAELARFRSPGNYGFSDAEIDENLFRLLEKSGALERFSPPELTASVADGTPRNRASTAIYRVR